MSIRKNIASFFIFVFLFCFPRLETIAEQFIVKDGNPNAEIVVSKEAPRMARLAALELQYYLQKISGARLPIVFKTTGKYPLKIYVGESGYTDKLGITNKDLEYGAFRMMSGADYLALLGGDYNYNPPRPYPKKRSDKTRAYNDWKKKIAGKTDSAWSFPWFSYFKKWWNPKDFDEIMANRYGGDNKKVWNPKGLEWTIDYHKEGDGNGYWLQDGAGSLNAVYSFLRDLGARWYMPGDLGEIIPKRETIALPDVNETVKPDFAARYWFWYNYSGFSFDDIMWARRLGIGGYSEVVGDLSHAHGLCLVHGAEEMRKKHPEYYALLGGVRDTKHRGYGTACHSSKGLMKEAVNFARYMFDEYNQPHVSLMPGDGFLKCGCDDCKDKTPSELVWGFVNNVAKELYKTHPDRLVSCAAYTSYAPPPKNIDKFSPNVLVFIGKSMKPYMEDPTWWKKYQEKVAVWQKKVAPGMLIRGENNRYHLNNGKPLTFPVLFPHGMAKDLTFLKGISIGDTAELSQRKATFQAPGSDHLNLYVQTRFLWNADQDIDVLLDEYFPNFYGPAANIMRKTFMDAEKTYRTLKLHPSQDLNEAKINYLTASVNFLEGMHKALKVVGEDTVYGKRIALIISEYVPLDKVKEDLDHTKNAPDPRADAPLVMGVDADSGKTPLVYHLKDYKTGEKPEQDTSFTVTWNNGNLIFNVRCEDDDMENLFSTEFVWDGDSVALLLETPHHAYYQIEVNPDGKVFDADREVGVVKRWKSQARVETAKGENFWTAKIIIPIKTPEENIGDPYHYIVGSKPSKDKLWYFNMGRARVRDLKRDSVQTFVPTEGTYHRKEKFAKLAID